MNMKKSMDLAEFNKEFASTIPTKDVLTPVGSVLLPEGDVLNTEGLVTQIQKLVIRCIQEQGIQNHSQIPELMKNLDAVYTRAMALDRIFNHPPREGAAERKPPIIARYNSHGELELVNNAYLSVAKLDSGEQAKELVRQGKFIEHMYDEKEALRVAAMKPLIAKGGYSGEIFTMRSGFKGRWTSLPNQEYGGDVRVAEDITGIVNPPRIFSTEGIKDIPFRFYSLVKDLRERVSTIIGDADKFLSDFEQLMPLSYIGDIIVDKGPFFIVLKQGDEYLSVNKSYVAATGYTLEELLQNKKLYSGNEKEAVDAYLRSLGKMEHYYASFGLRRKSGKLLAANWDTFRISDNTENLGQKFHICQKISTVLLDCFNEDEIEKILETLGINTPISLFRILKSSENEFDFLLKTSVTPIFLDGTPQNMFDILYDSKNETDFLMKIFSINKTVATALVEIITSSFAPSKDEEKEEDRFLDYIDRMKQDLNISEEKRVKLGERPDKVKKMNLMKKALRYNKSITTIRVGNTVESIEAIQANEDIRRSLEGKDS